MDLEALFTLLNTAVLPFWLLIMVAPRWVWTRRIAYSVAVAVVYAPIYAWLLFTAPEAPGASF